MSGRIEQNTIGAVSPAWAILDNSSMALLGG
jgi:hypothetical protein